MDTSVIVALITTSGTALVAVTALTLNYRGFNSIERRLEVIESDLKQFNRIVTTLEFDVTRIREKLSLS